MRSLRPVFAMLSLAVLLAGCSANVAQPQPPAASSAQTPPPPSAAAPATSSPPQTPGQPRTMASQPPTTAEKLAPIAPTIYSHGPRTRRQVALTFDLCEGPSDHPGFDQKLADELLAANVPATLFVGGKWAQDHQAAAKWLGQQPNFEIGQHSWDHPHFATLTRSQARSEIERAQEEVARATGHTPRFFRFPYGEATTEALGILGKMGITAIQWDVESGDPDPAENPRAMMSDIKRWLRPGSIVIMHMNGRGVHSAETLPTLIKYLRAHGYELVKASDLVRGAKMDAHPIMGYTKAGLPVGGPR